MARLRATGLDVAVLGDPVEAEGEVVEVTNPVVGSHRRLVVRDGVVVAATLVGDLSRVGLITQHFDRRTVLGAAEPGALLMSDRPPSPHTFAADAEVCACAGVIGVRPVFLNSPSGPSLETSSPGRSRMPCLPSVNVVTCWVWQPRHCARAGASIQVERLLAVV